MRFITLIAKNVMHRPVRTVLTTVGLAVAIAAVIILVGISWNFENSFLAIYRTKGIDLVVVQRRQLQPALEQPGCPPGRSAAADRGRGRCRPVLGGHRRVRRQEPGERAGRRLGSRQPAVPRDPHARRPGVESPATRRPSCSAGSWR